MWKDWLSFSRREQLGIISLSVLIILLLAFRLLRPLMFPQVDPEMEVVDPVVVEEKEPPDHQAEKDENRGEESSHGTQLAPFDPNRVSVTGLDEMGVPSHVIVNWMKYLEAGGRFDSAEDIGKIYGLDPDMENRLKRFAEIQTSESRFDTTAVRYDGSRITSSDGTGKTVSDSGTTFEEAPDAPHAVQQDTALFKLNINEASAIDFQELHGIGEVFSERIVKFRKSLGGFFEIEQISEVYGISEELFDSIRPHLVITGGPEEKINVNRASVRRLRAHPYLDFYQAREIVEHRNKHGSIKDKTILESFSSFDDDNLESILPYLSFGSPKEEN
ncbi:MAG: helix-hairpin-helix domain-containing protein [Marinilabilia sp.]